MVAATRETPSTAFGLSLAGGIIILLAGLVVAAVGATLTFFIGGIGGLVGIVGVVWGILIIVFAFLLRSMPEKHVGLGVAVILFSIFSWFGSFGGFLIGFLLALIGGVLAIVWTPRGTSASVAMPSSPAMAAHTVAVSGASINFCASCGSPVQPGSQFCENCGKPL